MSQHYANIIWQRESADFTYQSYNRNHEWQFENGVTIKASAAPEFLGVKNRTDPEEAYVASISSCHMLTFLAICARKRIVVDRYHDKAVGFMEKNSDGKLAITRVELTPVISFSGTAPSEELIYSIHHQSHTDCFIANSVTTEILVRS